MPKIIKDARETIVRAAREALLTEGIEQMNMRAVAKSAGVASGTLYNYFPSKAVMIEEVMRKDWAQMIEKTEQRVVFAQTATRGLELIFDTIRAYSGLYRETWSTQHTVEQFHEKRPSYHREIVEQINGLVRSLGVRFGFLFDESVVPFLSEVLLTSACHPDTQFALISPSLQKLVGEWK